MTKKEIKEQLLSAFDVLHFRRDGVIVAHRSYYYHNGQTVENLAAGIKQRIPGAIIINTEDHFRNWPNESFFQVKFRVEN